MKILQALVLLFFLSSFAKAQACGPIFFRILLKDSKGRTIKNAKIETFDKEFNKERFPFDKPVSWSEEEQTYFGVQGLGGAAYGTGFRISADGFETFEKVLDLPFGWHAYSITLKAKESNEISKISKLSVINGSISNAAGQRINNVKVTAFDKEKRVVYSVGSWNGHYWLFLSKGRYDLQFESDGFDTAVIKNFEVPDSEGEIRSKDKVLNLTLKVTDVEANSTNK